MNPKEKALRKRRTAIRAARKAGLTDDEICEALHIKPEDLAKAEAIDVEVVEIEDVEVVGIEDKSGVQDKGRQSEQYAKRSVNGGGREIALVEETHRVNNRSTGYPPDWRDGTRQPKDGTTNHVGVRRNSDEWWSLQKPETQLRRCKRIKRDGTQCKRMAWRGTTVCGHHGAKAPQVLNKAKQRLELAADRMAGNLLTLAENADTDAVKVRATESALDRAGVVKPQHVNVGVEVKPYEEVFDSIYSGPDYSDDYSNDSGPSQNYGVGNGSHPSSSLQSDRATDRGTTTLGATEDGIDYAPREFTDSAEPGSFGPSGAGSEYRVSGGPHHHPAPVYGQESSAATTGTGRATTAPRDRRGTAEGDSDRLSGPQSDERGHRVPSQGRGGPRPVTGADALAVAAELRRDQAERYGLPEGRSTRRRQLR